MLRLTRMRTYAAFALLLGSPLAAWWNWSSAPAESAAAASRLPADEQTPKSVVAAPDQVPDARGAPSRYCVDRLLTPIISLAGYPPESVGQPEPPPAGVITATTPSGGEDPGHAVQSSSNWLARTGLAAAELRSALGPNSQLDVVIATIPDPIDSGMVSAFETTIQAIHTGYEANAGDGHHYFRDRGFSPWDDRDVPVAQRADSASCRYSTPGLLLFRTSQTRVPDTRESSQPRALAVLLVGETPTRGLHGAAMLNALRVSELLRRGDGADRRLKILGPTFSGSAYSLHLALRQFAEQTTLGPVQIISGTASGADVPELLRTPVASVEPSYVATTVPEAAAECSYLYYLHRRLGVAKAGDRLEGVASLSESGTEFGATVGVADGKRAGRCPLRAAFSLSFPVNISFLRDAYEDLDHKKGSDQTDSNVARATTLELSLQEEHQPIDIGANPSAKTSAAIDVTLSAVLREIARRNIRHVGIHATTIGDAIFLARKIRDIAPDVRLAFFTSDAILLHPQYRPVLLGSLVVTPYPFLGVNDFEFRTPSIVGFPSASAEGLVNAVLAQRGTPATGLYDYAFGDNEPRLPVWISTLGRDGLVPTDVKPALDCSGTIYDRNNDGIMRELCQGKRRAWPQLNTLRRAHLTIQPSILLPRFWNFLFVALLFVFYFDQARENRTESRFARDLMPLSLAQGDDREADRAIGRTKWFLYAAIRRFVFVLAFTYMGIVYVLAGVARATGFGEAWVWFTMAFCIAVVAVSTHNCWCAVDRFWSEYRAFARYVGQSIFPTSFADLKQGMSSGRISEADADADTTLPAVGTHPSHGLAKRFSLSLGLAPPIGRVEAARVSFAQLRLVALVTAVLVLLFSCCVLGNALNSTDYTIADAGAVPAWTFTVLRNVPLFNGISPAAPALLCMACVYVWAVGRMARIALAHSISRIAPSDGEHDLVSTPIRLVLFPQQHKGSYDEGFTATERDLVNSIWRPITGRYYTVALLAVLFFPTLLFFLKPLSTLEETWGCVLLCSGLALCGVLIGVTLIQLVQFWICLERLLKRVMAHPLGPVFSQLPNFVRDSIDHQVSRSPNELLRWVAGARQFGDLVSALLGLRELPVSVQVCEQLQDTRRNLSERVKHALKLAEEPRASAHHEVQLGEQVIAAASHVMLVLEQAYEPPTQRSSEAARAALVEGAAANQQLLFASDGTHDHPLAASSTALASDRVAIAANRPAAIASVTADAGAARKPDRVDDALSPVAYRHAADALQWYRQAQVFVATVTTLLIHRHIRQFRYFISTLTLAVVLLLLAVTSYPFEPYRLLLTCIWALMASVVGVGLWVYVQLDRNTLLSLMAGTSPNRLTLDHAFGLRVFTWGVVPLLTVAAAQYPDFANFLYKLVTPFLHVLR